MATSSDRLLRTSQFQRGFQRPRWRTHGHELGALGVSPGPDGLAIAFGCLVLVLLSWGVLAFGAVYPWAYRPLLWGAWLLGGVALAMRTTRHAGLPRSIGPALWLGLVAIAAVLLVQLVALPADVLERISPSTHQFLEAYDIPYAAALLSDRVPAHPISLKPEASALGTTFFLSLAVLFVACTAMLERGAARPIVIGLVCLGTVVALMALAQKAMVPRKIYGFWEPTDGHSPFGPFVNRNHFAGWMLMTLSVSLGYLAAALPARRRPRLRDWRDRLAWLASAQANRIALASAGILVMSIALALTTSRSGIMGFLLAAAVVGVFALRTRRDEVSRPFMAVYVVLLVILTVSWVGVDSVGQHFTDTPVDADIKRLGIWKNTLAVVDDFPLTGTGLNTFGTVMLVYQTVDPHVAVQAAHNDYLQLAAEGGLLLGIPIAFTVVAFARQTVGRLRESPGGRRVHWLRVGAVTGLLAMGLQETVEFSLQMPGNATLFAVLAALAVHRPPPAPSSEPHRGRC